MTTDTALALLAEAKDMVRLFGMDSCRSGDQRDANDLCDRITALLDSGIKDAGDDVAEPEPTMLAAMRLVGNAPEVIKYIDTLPSAYKRTQQEKKTVIDVYEDNLREAGKRLIFWQERAEKAEAELASLRLELARLDGEIPYGN